MSIALSTSSSFFGLSLLARLVPMGSVLKSSYPNGPYPLYYIHPCLDQKENLFLFLKKQEPVSIALSTSSSFFGLSLLARLVPMDSVLKSSILIVQKLTLHQNGVEFHQQFNGAIRTSLSAPYDNVRCCAGLRSNKLAPYYSVWG